MICALKISPCSITSLPKVSPSIFYSHNVSWICPEPIYRNHPSVTDYRTFSSPRAMPSSVGDVQKRSNLESLFCYEKPVPEEIIEKPIGLSLALKNVGDNPHCPSCQAKGAVLCTTCSGSGLYVESILESQGIIVKVRCLGCGGTGNTMCSGCGGRGHLDLA
ncbi:DnaJ/Hsp40 cysteine-rich domain superfamily protein [Abeliophyllum distichum]|uniref:DnaJ/Hsp40 cysteine-rich domain superfamily protein n=1 Tax=Abeliophyllum distichum TaxID=126358 RepID=A0ABD1VBI1_9LAMI